MSNPSIHIAAEILALYALNDLEEAIGCFPCSCMGGSLGYCEGGCEYCDLKQHTDILRTKLQEHVYKLVR